MAPADLQSSAGATATKETADPKVGVTETAVQIAATKLLAAPFITALKTKPPVVPVGGQTTAPPKLPRRQWRRLFREQEEEREAIRFAGVKHFATGIPPPSGGISDDASDGATSATAKAVNGNLMVTFSEGESSKILGKRKGDSEFCVSEEDSLGG